MMSLMQRIWAVALLLAVFGYPAISQTDYSRSIDLAPLRVSMSDLQAVVDKSAALMAAADGSRSRVREKIALAKGELRVTIQGHQLDPAGAKIPQSIDSFEYRASTIDTAAQSSAPITNVQLSFADYKRSLSVEGQSPEQVDALFSALRDDLDKLTTPVGGSMFRSTAGPVLFFLLIMIMFTLIMGMISNETRRLALLWPCLVSAGLLVALVMLPTEDFLAGFSAVRGDASFTVRYAPQIGLWSLLFAVGAMAMSFVPFLQQRTAQSELATDDGIPHRDGRKPQVSKAAKHSD